MEDFNILDSLNRIKEQIYIDFNTINSLNNYLDSLKLSNQNKDYSKTISLMNEDSQRKLEEFQKENQLLQNRIQKLEELIQSNKMEYQNILNNNENYLKIIEQQKVTINNLKDQLNIKENCDKILNENNNFIFNIIYLSFFSIHEAYKFKININYQLFKKYGLLILLFVYYINYN